MDRKNEYLNLIEELDGKSEKMNNLYKKANRRLMKKRAITAVTAILSSTASLLVIFTILINTVHSFAYACGGVPVLKDLAKFAAMSPSLRAAVEYQYIQPIEISKTKDDITAGIEYIIVDQKQVNIFFSLKSEKYKTLDAFPEVFDENGKFLSCTSSYGNPNEKSELKMFTLDFIDENVPNFISLKLKVNDNGELIQELLVDDEKNNNMMVLEDEVWEEPEYISEFVFDINLDPSYTAQGQTLNMNKEFEADGQILTITTVDIYPTHIRINLEADEKNTKWLKSLNFRIENEKGKKFDKISNGISATGSSETPMMVSHRLESSFFSRSKELTLFIDDITWLDKDKEKIKIDLKNSKHDALPENVELYNINKYNNGWKIEFLTTSGKPNHTFNTFSNIYHDVDGNRYNMNHSSTTWTMPGENGNDVLEENQFLETLYLTDYPYDAVYLDALYTSTFKLDNPIEIKIK